MNSDKIRFSCPTCGTQLDVPASLAGISGPCPSCQSTITAPSAPPQEPTFSQPSAPAPTPAPAPAPAPVSLPDPEPILAPAPISAQLETAPPVQPQRNRNEAPFPSAPTPVVPAAPEASGPDFALDSGQPQVRTSPQEAGFPLQEPEPAASSIPSHKNRTPGAPTSRGGAIKKVSDLQTTPSPAEHSPRVKNKSRIPSLLFILAVFFIAGSCIVALLKVNGIFNLDLPFLPSSQSPTQVEVGSDLPPLNPSTGIDTVIDGVGTQMATPPEIDPLSIDPEMPSKGEATPPPSLEPLPAGENFREGETPLSSEIELSEASESEIFSQQLTTFLTAKNLVERENVISATALQDPRISKSILAGPLPPPTSTNHWTRFNDPAENRTDFFYLVSWDGERGTPVKPIAVQLHRWNEREEPTIHAEAFLEAYEGALMRYAATAREEPARFHVVGRCIPKCFEIIPNAIDKATLKLTSFPRDNTPIKAYFSKNGDLLDEFKDNLDGIAMKEEVPLTVTLQWSDPAESPRYLELIRVDSFDWHP